MEAYFAGYIYNRHFGGNNQTTGVDASNSNHDVNLLARGLQDKTYENGLLWIRYGVLLDDLNRYGVQLDVKFTDVDLSNAYWTQWIVTNSPREMFGDFSYDPISGMYSYWDDTQSHIGRYYSNSKMTQHILGFGTSVTFGDGPRRFLSYTSNIFWSAELSLINNGNTVLQINYGFTIDSTGSHPLPYSYKIY